MAVEKESKNKDLDLGSVRHSDQDKSDTRSRLALKTLAYGITTQNIFCVD